MIPQTEIPLLLRRSRPTTMTVNYFFVTLMCSYGPVEAPNNGQTQQQKQQDCLNKINNTPDGKFYNFWSLTSPLIGPNKLGSAIEDFGGTGLKYLAYRGLACPVICTIEIVSVAQR